MRTLAVMAILGIFLLVVGSYFRMEKTKTEIEVELTKQTIQEMRAANRLQIYQLILMRCGPRGGRFLGNNIECTPEVLGEREELL